ncbi:hypothetical protein N799_02265 [Lysobacter arseniciresistens ZS79]|uniref:Uncharacterized protein n=1 Tax=Lysobacter arseniciresistens ZS79 TaxID=913325 RepID=A0A0A0F1R3_9GAMM|nr:hypothetical protein [Lysobacter arseniciresistens]KGM56734.1 hypothetical protein N799_02265 [Lysobacter arseniciresistens ZS79]
MSLFRPTLIAAALAVGLVACSGSEPPAETTGATPGPANDAAMAGPAADPVAGNDGAVPEGDAAELDARLVELGWAGAAATNHAYAEACGASAAELDAHLAAQREQATAMGTAAAEFDRQFEEALPVATRRVAIDDVAMSGGRRTDTCETVLASLR